MIVGIDIRGHHVAAAAVDATARGALVPDSYLHVTCATGCRQSPDQTYRRNVPNR